MKHDCQIAYCQLFRRQLLGSLLVEVNWMKLAWLFLFLPGYDIVQQSTIKHLCRSLFFEKLKASLQLYLKKRLRHEFYPMSFAMFLRTRILHQIRERQFLVDLCLTCNQQTFSNAVLYAAKLESTRLAIYMILCKFTGYVNTSFESKYQFWFFASWYYPKIVTIITIRT